MQGLQISIWCKLGLHRWYVHRTFNSMLYHKAYYPKQTIIYKCDRICCTATKTKTK